MKYSKLFYSLTLMTFIWSSGWQVADAQVKVLCQNKKTRVIATRMDTCRGSETRLISTDLLTGAKGDQGAQGLKGDKGDTGATGAQGAKGNTGDQGLKGDKGDTGEQGLTGSVDPSQCSIVTQSNATPELVATATVDCTTLPGPKSYFLQVWGFSDDGTAPVLQSADTTVLNGIQTGITISVTDGAPHTVTAKAVCCPYDA